MNAAEMNQEHDKTNGNGHPSVSLVIPAFNEEKYIGSLLDQMLHQDYPQDKIEIFVADGGSSDKTREIVSTYAGKNPRIKLLLNKKQYVPFALNMGIRESKGDYVIILGAHSSYPLNYIASLIKASLSLNADNVGGLCIGNPPDTSLKALAIAQAMSSAFGVGDAHFRIGSREIKQVDTVTFGCYKRSVFDRIGYFDEELLRNQDDEFNARLTKNQGTIYLIPDIEVTYFTRASISSVMKMFYQYGFFKPLVSLKIGRPTTVRQLVPFLFVVFIISSIGLGFLSSLFWKFLGAVLLLHLFLGIVFGLKIVGKTQRPGLLIYLPWLFFLIQTSYGWGYIRGIFKFIIFRERIQGVGSTR